MSARGVLAWGSAALALAVVLAVIGGLVPDNLRLAAALSAFLFMFGLTAYEPVAVPILMMPAMAIVQRMPGVDLSISDFALFGAFWFALIFAPRPYTKPMRSMLWLSLIYQAATLFTVIANPFLANRIEWFHAWLSVGGALVVGWAVGRSGRTRLGLTLLLIPCLAIAALTIAPGIDALGDGSGVYLSWPYEMHKNHIGTLLGVAALLTYARPSWVGWPRWFTFSAFWLLTAGVVLSGARQALVGLTVGILLIALRKDPDRKRSKLVLLAVIPGIVGVLLATQEQLASNNRFNSANQRLEWYRMTIDLWREHPWFGAGLRFWTTERTPMTGIQPPNAELEVLGSTGIVGLTGFLLMFFVGMAVLWRMNRRFGTLALALLIQRLATGQFDLFWSSVQVSLPFVLIGVCLGAEAYSTWRDEARHPTGLPLARGGLQPAKEIARR